MATAGVPDDDGAGAQDLGDVGAAPDAAVEQHLDGRLIPAGTNVRFALVIILALVSSARMMLEFAFNFTGRQLNRCELAAGIDLFRANSDPSLLAARLTQAAAYTNCAARLAKPPPWWLPTCWLLLVLVAAIFVFYAQLWWNTRWSRCKRISEYDNRVKEFVLSDEVQQLALTADIAVDLKRVVVDTSHAASTAVFGSNRRPVLRLQWALVNQRLTCAAESKEDPEFKAVLLHEFEHIRSGDVTAAWGTIAVWRGFLLVALLPYLVITAIVLAHGSIAGLGELGSNSAVDERDLLITLVLACLGYLARSDVLRVRELYADREPVDKGYMATSDVRRAWAIYTDKEIADNDLDEDRCTADEHGIRSQVRRGARAFAEMWRSHPSWALRSRSLDDSSALFTVEAAPVFLAGVAAALIFADFQYVVQLYGQGSTWFGSQWMYQGTGALPAALVTLIVGIALWRQVAYDRQGKQKPVTVLAFGTGLWLGAGMITGDLAAGQGTIGQLMPSRPEVLLLVLAAGTGFSWWTVNCAGVWLGRWEGRIPHWAMSVGLGGGFLILSWWFSWWGAAGDPYSAGISISPSGYQRYLEYIYTGPVAHPAILTVISWLGFGMSQLALRPATLLAVGAAWVVPLLAWTRRPATDADGLPSLRDSVVWAVAGAVATWICVIAAQAYMHVTQPPQPPQHGLYELTYVWLLFGAQVVPALVVTLAVGLRRGRFRLLVTLIAAEGTMLAGFAGTFVLFSVDGCVRPLNTMESSCAWRPGLIKWAYPTQVNAPALVTALAVFAVCGLALAHPAVRRGYRAAQGHTGWQYANSKAIVIGFAGMTALGVALVGIVLQLPAQTHSISAAILVTDQVGYQLSLTPETSAPTPPPQVAGLEAENWSELGGAALLSRLQSDAAKLSPMLAADLARQHSYTVQDFQAIKPVCADIVVVSQESNAYFLLPDARARPWWSGFAWFAGTGGRGCESAIALLTRGHFSTSFWTALDRSFRQIGQAYVNTGFIAARIETLEEAGGITGYGNGIAGPSLNLLPPPTGTRPWSRTGNTGNPMDLPVAVARLYPVSDWASEETWLSTHEFVSAAREGWTYADGTQAAVIINRFAAASDAASQIGSWDANFRQESAPAAALTDPADGGMGVAISDSEQKPDVKTEMAAHIGSYVIEVQVYARTPAPAIAKALLRQQYARLKAGGA